MELTVKAETMLSEYDTGGGCCKLTAEISYDPSVSKRLQREGIIHEVFEALFGAVLSHEKIEDATDTMSDALEQWEAHGENQ